MKTKIKNKKNVSLNYKVFTSAQMGELLAIPMDYKGKAQYFRELAETWGRSVVSIENKYYKLHKQFPQEERPKLDLSFIGDKQPLFIPEKSTTNLFMEEVNVLMFKAMDGSLHYKAQDAVKANIRTILDSYDEVRDNPNTDDKECHEWFIQNKSKVEYLLNTSAEDLWN